MIFRFAVNVEKTGFNKLQKLVWQRWPRNECWAVAHVVNEVGDCLLNVEAVPVEESQKYFVID